MPKRKTGLSVLKSKPKSKAASYSKPSTKGVSPSIKKKKSYLVKDVDAAYREVQGKMRKLAAEVQKTDVGTTAFRKGKDGRRQVMSAGAGITRIDLNSKAMKMREARTKAISAAAKKHGVPKTEITKRKPINPGEMLSKKVHNAKNRKGVGTGRLSIPRPVPATRRR